MVSTRHHRMGDGEACAKILPYFLSFSSMTGVSKVEFNLRVKLPWPISMNDPDSRTLSWMLPHCTGTSPHGNGVFLDAGQADSCMQAHTHATLSVVTRLWCLFCLFLVLARALNKLLRRYLVNASCGLFVFVQVICTYPLQQLC
jgi:hypothetical protein